MSKQSIYSKRSNLTIGFHGYINILVTVDNPSDDFWGQPYQDICLKYTLYGLYEF